MPHSLEGESLLVVLEGSALRPGRIYGDSPPADADKDRGLAESSQVELSCRNVFHS